MKVLRVYHGGRDVAHRARERALLRAGVDLHLVVPAHWGRADRLVEEGYLVTEGPVDRPGDVNRHRYQDLEPLLEIVRLWRPDVVDLHEEPFAAVTRQWLRALDPQQTVVTYTAQNLDKRWPPPFHQYERAAMSRLQGVYPCAAQAASVLRGKGYQGLIKVLPLGLDLDRLRPGEQRHDDDVFTLLLLGRLVPEKGVRDAVRVLAALRQHRRARLVVVGEGPEAPAAAALATELGLGADLEQHGWLDAEGVAGAYRAAHVVLVPSSATRTWVEQFGRVITEGQASGAVVAGYASGSIPEVLADLGPAVPEGRADLLADAVLALAQDRQRWEDLRRRGLERAQRWSWEQVAYEQVALYEEALRAPRRLPVRPDRRAAVEEFGPPAEVAGGGRPFAVPVLREDRPWTSALGRAIDVVTRSS